MMNQITIRGLSSELERKVRAIVDREGISLNQAILRLLQKGAGLQREAGGGAETAGSSLDEFIGSWTTRQAAEAEKAISLFEKVDPPFWS